MGLLGFGSTDQGSLLVLGRWDLGALVGSRYVQRRRRESSWREACGWH